MDFPLVIYDQNQFHSCSIHTQACNIPNSQLTVISHHSVILPTSGSIPEAVRKLDLRVLVRPATFKLLNPHPLSELIFYSSFPFHKLPETVCIVISISSIFTNHLFSQTAVKHNELYLPQTAVNHHI
jgi:hypothetical protein